MCLPAAAVGVISGISSAASAVGGFVDSQSQASAANAASIRNYKYQIARREGDWARQLSIYRGKVGDYNSETRENNSAAGRSYAAEQVRLNEQFQQAAFQKQDMLGQLVQAQGGIQASGIQGNTAGRMNTAALAAFGRNNAVIAANLSSARNAMMMRNEDVQMQLRGANRKAWNNVALPPVPDMAPLPPTMVPGPSGLGLVAGLGGALVQGMSAFNGLKAPEAYTGGAGAAASPFGGPSGVWSTPSQPTGYGTGPLIPMGNSVSGNYFSNPSKTNFNSYTPFV